MGQVRHLKGTKNNLSSAFLKEDDIAHAVDRGELVLTDASGTKTFLSNNGYYGDTLSTGAAGAFAVTIEGIKALYQGLKLMLHLKKATSASANTVNINGLGNTPIFKHLAEPLTDILPAGTILQMVYSNAAAGFILISPINDYYNKQYVDNLSNSLYSLLSYDSPFGLAISMLEEYVNGLLSVVNAAIPFGYIMRVDPKSLNLNLRAGMIWYYQFDDWGDIETTAPYTPYKQLDKDLIWRTMSYRPIPEGVNFYCVTDNTILVYANKMWHELSSS